MPSSLLLPYENLGDAIGVSVASVSAAGITVDGLVVQAAHRESDDPFTISISCELASASRTRVESEPDLAIRLREVSITSRTRRLHSPTTSASGGMAQFEILVDPTRTRGSIELTPVLVRTTGPLNTVESAGQLLGWGEDVIVVVDEQPPPPGNGLPITWRSFADKGLPATNLFHLDASEEIPTILLNSDVAGLKDILDNRAPTGRKARIRDSVFSQIALQVWTSLLVECLSQVQEAVDEDSERTLRDIASDLPPWQSSVIEDWFPRLLGSGSLDERLEAEDFAGVVLDRIPMVIQQKIGTAKLGFEGLRKEFGLLEAGDES